MWRVGRAADKEGLRMMLAFLSIEDPAQRLRLIQLAEALAAGALPDGIALQDNAQAEQPAP